MEKYKKFAVILLLSFVLLGFLTPVAKAQFQDYEFSGNKKESYQCPDPDTGKPSVDRVSDVRRNGYWLCMCNDNPPSSPDATTGRCGSDTKCDADERPGDDGCLAEQAALRPPKLQQLEIWFVRVVYVVWGIVGSLAFLYLMVLAYRYVISRGDVTKITEIRQKILYYFIGLVLVFLAVPILTTIFRLMGINNSVQCYDVFEEETLGFQFFFQDLCTDPDNTIGTNLCAAIIEGYQDAQNSSGGTGVFDAIRQSIADVDGTPCSGQQSPPGCMGVSVTCTGNTWRVTCGPPASSTVLDFCRDI